MSPLVTEERAALAKSADAAAQSTSGVEVISGRGISPSVTEERATTSRDSAAQSTSGVKVTGTRGTAATQRLGVEGNLDHLP